MAAVFLRHSGLPPGMRQHTARARAQMPTTSSSSSCWSHHKDLPPSFSPSLPPSLPLSPSLSLHPPLPLSLSLSLPPPLSPCAVSLSDPPTPLSPTEILRRLSITPVPISHASLHLPPFSGRPSDASPVARARRTRLSVRNDRTSCRQMLTAPVGVHVASGLLPTPSPLPPPPGLPPPHSTSVVVESPPPNFAVRV